MSDTGADRHEATQEEPRVSGTAPRGQHEEVTPPPSEHAHADHDDPLADAFFRHPDKPVIDVWEDPAPVHKMSRGSKRAMQASIGIFLASTLCIASYSIYQNWIMPAPVELGAGAGDIPAVLPTPVAAPEPSLEPAAARVVAAPAMAAAAEAPAEETQLAAATDPDLSPSSPVPADTLAAIAARPAAAPAPEGTPNVDGAIGAHLLASAAETARASAGEPLAAAPGGIVPAAPVIEDAPDREPARALGSGPGGPTYDELVEVGRALSKRNRRVEASEAFRRALLKSPSGSAALSGLGYVYLNADENQTARLYAQRAVQADDTNAEGWIVLGAALELLGDKTGAQDAYRNCVARGQGPYLLECRRVVR